MASAYSILHNYRQDLYSPNLQLINEVEQYKQNTLNANRQKLQSMYDQFSFLDVAKEQDKNYLEDRLQAVKGVVDKYSALDLSSNNLTGQLMQNMTQVVDDNVKKAVVSTKIYNAEQAAWGKLKADNPEKYNQTNHLYANRASQAWLNDGKTGSDYKGGGGVIEYTDVQGKLSKEIPNIAKALKAEWVELAQGGGYFRDQVTKEKVDRRQMEKAMDGLLNDQDKRQLQINAWGQYDGMSDEQLEASYSAHFEPKINVLKANIKSLEGAISSTKNPQVKAQRESLLDAYRGQLDTYKANNFQNIVKNYGRESAYQSLYDNKFRGNYLDAYSYADRTTKIAIYNNDLQTRNYEYKLANLQRLKEKDAFSRQLSLAKLENQKQSAKSSTGGKGTSTAPGTSGYQAPLVGIEAPLGYEESTSKIAEHNANNKRIINETQKLFGIDNLGDTRGLANVLNEGFAGKEFIEYNGKKIKVKDNLGLLLEYQNNIMKQSPVEKEAFKQFNNAMGKSLGNLRRVAQGDNPDWDAVAGTPRYNFKFVKDKETNTMKKVVIDGNSSNNYAALLKKETLTPEEKYTLDVYYKMHLLMDPDIDNDHKELLYQDLRNNQFSKLNNEDFNSFPEDIHGYNRIAGRAPKGSQPRSLTTDYGYLLEKDGFFDRHPKIAGVDIPGSISIASNSYSGIMSDIVDAYKIYDNASGEQKEIARQKIQSLEDILVKDEKLLENRTGFIDVYRDYFLSSVGQGDTEFYDKDGNEVSLDSPSKFITQGTSLYAKTLETAYKDQNLNPSLYPQIFNNETSGYNNLTTLVGLPAGSKEPITLERVWDPETKQPTGEVKWSYIKNVKVDGEYTQQVVSSEDGGVTGRLKVDQLRDNSIIDFNQAKRSTYDASWGENANTIDLGNNIYDETLAIQHAGKYGNTLALHPDNVTDLAPAAKKFGGDTFVAEISSDLKAFTDGAYSFKMESIGGIWNYSVYLDGERKHKMPTEENGITLYSTSEVAYIHQEIPYIVNLVMRDYLEDKIMKKRAEYLYNLQNHINQ